MDPWNDEGGYEIEVSRKVMKTFVDFPREIQERLSPRIESLATDPRPRGCEKLEGFKNAFRIRVGDYRVIYEVDDEAEVVTISRIATRGRAYRSF